MAVLFQQANPKQKLFFAGFGGFWLATITFGFAASIEQIGQSLIAKLEQGLNQEKNVRAYLCTEDFSYLQNKPFQYIPYPSPERLKSLLDNSTIRNILPENIHAPSLCNLAAYTFPFKIVGTIGQASSRVVNTKAIIKNEWQGTDYYSISTGKTTLPGFKVIGSFKSSDTEKGELVLHLKKGDQVWYLSEIAPAHKQRIVIDGLADKFTQIPEISNQKEWLLLEFSHAKLPNEFDVKFIDGGDGWGEWSAVGLNP
jgi:hypothetical protein